MKDSAGKVRLIQFLFIKAGILQTIEDFIKAVGRVREAGFDGVQLHAAHDYLLTQFLSPMTNKRKDMWGGKLENRYRIIYGILKGCKSRYPGFPLFIKLNADDFHKKGLSLNDSTVLAGWLERDGCQGIEISCGSASKGFAVTRGKELPIDAILAKAPQFREKPSWLKRLLRPVIGLALKTSPDPLTLYNTQAAKTFRNNCNLPIIDVGGHPDLESIRKVLESESADFVSLSRPLILEPDLPYKYASGKQEKSRCLYCNFCTIAQLTEPTRCYYGKVNK